jgi:hypothetical protein
MNQMIQQKPFLGLRGIFIKLPRALALANGIPCPDGVSLTPSMTATGTRILP